MNPDLPILLDNQVALELLEDGRLATSDDPAIIFGCLSSDFIEQVCFLISLISVKPNTTWTIIIYSY